MSEHWKPVSGFEGLYEVSDHGRVKSLRRTCYSRSGGRLVPETILRPDMRRSGYPSVTLFHQDKRTRRLISHIVAEAFIGPRPVGMELCHNDGDRANSMATNLRYDTAAANQADRRKHGTLARRSGVLSIEHVRRIKLLSAQGASGLSLAREFGVSQSGISHILTGRNWASVNG